MYLKGISIQNYRNLQPVSLGLNEGFWQVLGSNGQGKSNLLEAIQVLCLGKSKKAERDKDLVRFGETFFRLEGRFQREERGNLESVVRFSPDGKELLVFDTPVPRLANFIGEASCVVFISDDVNVILGEPTERRTFLNEANSQLSQGYIFDMSRYRRALEQKNKLLKDVRERLAPTDALDIWDQNLAQYGGRVCARRARFIRQIGECAEDLYKQLSDEAETLEIRYDPTIEPPETPEEWPSVMLSAIHEKRSEEIRRGVSLIGPQRDDLTITLNGLNARSFASRGQARTVALALRLAQAELAFKQTQEWPVLLLDDVFPELDMERRKLLARIAAKAQQVFATAACEVDIPSVEGLEFGQIDVSQGKIEIIRRAKTSASGEPTV